MDLEGLKDKWQRIAVKTDALEDGNRRLAQELASGRIRTAQRSLVDFYIKAGIIGLCVVALSPMIVTVLEFPIWVAVVYGVFGLIMSILNFCFSRRIARTSYISLPVVEALSLAVALRKKQKQLRAIGISFGLVVLLSLAVPAFDVSNDAVYIGFLSGLAIGIPLAIVKNRRATRLARKLQEELGRVGDSD